MNKVYTPATSLNSLMNNNDLTVAELSRRSGVADATIRSFFRYGTDNMKLSTLIKLCKYFNISADALVFPDKNILSFDSDNYSSSQLEEIKKYAESLKGGENNG